MKTVKMTRAAMVAMLVAAGWPKADKWEDDKVMERVIGLPEKFSPEDAEKLPDDLKAQYEALSEPDAELEMIPGELGSPKSGNGKASSAEPIPEKASAGKSATKGKSEAAPAKPAKKVPGEPRGGKLGGYKGYSITSVIRAFGKAGWKSAEAKAFFEEQNIPVSPTTISIQLRHGRLATGGEPAAISQAELKSIRPEVEEPAAKPAPTKAAAKPAAKPAKK